MDERSTKIIEKIIVYAEKVASYCNGLNEEQFLANTVIIEACVFNIIQIGESARLLDAEFMAKHNNIPWHKIRGLRNRIVHNYDGIDMLLIWDIINGDLPNLIRQLNNLKI